MNYRNSSTYVQKQVDKLLRDYFFARKYVNDIVVFFNSLEKHLRHFNEIFALFKRYNIVIKSFKTYLDYSIVQLLDQKIDNLDMTIVKNKIEIIVVLKFSHILKHFEIYLREIDYLRSYVTYYAQKTLTFQQRKIRLLKDDSIKERQRKIYSQKIVINDVIETKIDSFNQLQFAFNRLTFLVHYNRFRQLYIDVDASKERDLNIMIYHIKIRKNKNENSIFRDDFVSFDKLDIESILFLNKILSSIEKRYWSIELKMIVLIWSIRKLRIMIVNFDLSIIMYIDHVVNTIIVKQTKLIFNNVDELNLKLIRASIYLSQFRLKIFHRIDKFNVVFDALNQLSINRHSTSNIEIDSLDIESYHAFLKSFENDVIYVYNEFFLVMSIDFRKQLLVDYKNDKT